MAIPCKTSLFPACVARENMFGSLFEMNDVYTSGNADNTCVSGLLETNNMLGNSENKQEGSARKITLPPPPPPLPRAASNLCGIENRGATCYLNSLLQTLLFTPEFKESLLKLSKEELGWADEGNRSTKMRIIPIQLQKLFANLLLADLKAVSTTDLTDSFGWTGEEELQQHDVQELNRILFAAIEKSLVGTTGKDLISELYHGSTVNQVICCACGRVSEREESFLDLTLAVSGYQTIQESLYASFLETETMSGSNKYYCERCDTLVDATKGARLRKLPPILTVSLLRFSYDYQKLERYKETSHFSFPQVLDLGAFCEHEMPPEFTVYELFSVVIHSGSTHGGHYHAYIHDIDRLGNWIKPEMDSPDSPSTTGTDPALSDKEPAASLDKEPAVYVCKVLLQSSDRMLHLNMLCHHLPSMCGISWNKKFRRRWGPISKYISSKDHLFNYCPTSQMVGLQPGVTLESFATPAKVDRSMPQVPTGSQQNKRYLDGFLEWQEQKSRHKKGKRHKVVPVQEEDFPTPEQLVDESVPEIWEDVPEIVPCEEENWFDFNDTSVIPISKKNIEKQFSGKESAYMLFYRRKSLERPAGAVGNRSYQVPEHLVQYVESKNEELRRQREEYEAALNEIYIQLLPANSYEVRQCALHHIAGCPEPVEVVVDQRWTVDKLSDKIWEVCEDLCRGLSALHVCHKTVCGIHPYQQLDDPSKKLMDSGVTKNSKILVWDGRQVNGVLVEAGPENEPILLTVTVIYPNKESAETKEGYRKSMKLWELRDKLSESLSIPEHQLHLTYLKNKSESSNLIVLDRSKTISTLEELGLENGGRLLAEKRGKGKQRVTTQAMIHSKVITVTVENRTMVTVPESLEQGDAGRVVQVEIMKDRMVGELKEAAVSELHLPLGKYRMRLEDDTLGVKSPIHEHICLEEAHITSDSKLIIEEGPTVMKDEIWLQFSTSSVAGDNIPRQWEVIVKKNISVSECKEFMLQCAKLEGSSWHLRRTKWSGEPAEPLDDPAATLKEEGVRHGDHLCLMEGNVPLRGFVSINLFLYELSNPFNCGDDDVEKLVQGMADICADLLSSPKMDQAANPDSKAFGLGPLEIGQQCTLDNFKQQVIDCIVGSNSHNLSTENVRLRMIEQDGENSSLGRILRGHAQSLQGQKLSNGSAVGIQLLPHAEDLGPHQIVLEVWLHVPGSREYESPRELIWDASDASLKSLQQSVADLLHLPAERLLLAKYLPSKRDWLVLKEEQEQSAWKKSTKTLRCPPYSIADGSVIGVKDLSCSVDNLEDFQRESDIEYKRKLKLTAAERKRFLKEQCVGLPSYEDGSKDGARSLVDEKKKAERGIQIRVSNFT